jgi:putative DNA primase/helicase
MSPKRAFPAELEISTVECAADARPEPYRISWRELVRELKTPVRRALKDGPAFIPATFRKQHRVDECVEGVSALVLDLDGKEGPVTREQLSSLLDGYTYAAHTTFSSCPEHPRWRVWLPYAQPATLAEHAAAYEFMQQKFGRALDPACKNPSHIFYGPSCPTDMVGHFQAFDCEGEALDPSDLQRGAPQPEPRGFSSITVADLRVSGEVRLIILAGRPKGQRNEALWRAIRAMLRAGHSDDEIRSILLNRAYNLSVKPRERGVSWLDGEIRRAKSKPIQDDDDDTDAGASIRAHSVPTDDKLPCTDIGNAQRLVKAASGRLRHCVELKRWLWWSGKRWNWDTDGEIERLAKRTATSILVEAAFEKDKSRLNELWRWAKESQSVHRVRAMIELAKTERGIPVHAKELDADAMVLGTLNGVIDLRTGQLRAANPEDYVTKFANVIFNSDAKCPKWVRFINEVFGADQSLIEYVQRVVGYMLTGLTREQCMFVLHGHGANGKTVFTETLKHLLGDYAKMIPAQVLMARKQDNGGATPELVRLRGARLVLASESEEGSLLAAALVKSATGEETISARELYGNPMEFMPSFKLVLATNHKPIIKDDGYGMWRRLQLVPFAVTFPKERQNPTLRLELIEELPGILNWAIAGCLTWQSERLNPPTAVKAATEGYRSEMDLVEGWLADCCVQESNASTPFSQLYDSYEAWHHENGGFKLSRKMLASKLDERGFQAARDGKGQKCRRGLRLERPTFQRF